MTLRTRYRSILGVVLFWLVLSNAGLGDDLGPKEPPKPPTLKAARWQQFDRCFQDVFVDGSGRAWFLATTHHGALPGKNAFLVCPDQPGKVIELSGTDVPLGFDGKNRFWDINKYGLGATDVQHDEFSSRRPSKSDPPGTYPDILPFVRVMFEHSSGRLYFIDGHGVMHILDGNTWSTHEFSPPLQNVERLRGHPFVCFRMIEGPSGEVYLWSSTPGNGLWVQDGTTWKGYTGLDHPALASICELSPQTDGTLHIRSLSGLETTVTLPGRNPGATKPKIQTDSLLQDRNARFRRNRNTESLADITGEELSAYGTFLARDGRGRVYFFAEPPSMGWSFGWLAAFDARYSEEVPSLKYECVRLDSGFHTACFDSQRRVWARLSAKDQPFLSRYEGDHWTHFEDPTGWTPDRYPDHVLVKRSEQYWTMAPRPAVAGSTQSNLGPGTAISGPAMANPGYVQSLRESAMVAAEVEPYRAYLFDGRQWQTHESVKKLVEDNYAWLKQRIDNTAIPYNYDENPTRLALRRDGPRVAERKTVYGGLRREGLERSLQRCVSHVWISNECCRQSCGRRAAHCVTRRCGPPRA